MHASVIRDDDYLTKLLESAENGSKFVHYECRKKYTDKRRLTASAATPDNAKRLRSGQYCEFDWKTNCFLCGGHVKDDRHPNRNEVYMVRTLPLQDTILKRCDEREHP